VRRLLRLSAALLLIALVAACKDGGGDGGDGDSGGPLTLEAALQAMVLQVDDLPPDLVRAESSFGTNEQAAAGSAERKQLLDSWGRLLGFDVTFQPSGDSLQQQGVKGMNVSASLYQTEEGASQSFADAEKTVEDTDWATTYAGLRDFMQEELNVGDRADEIGWLRFSGFQPSNVPPDPLITDDLIYFRIGRERGFLRVLASSNETTDRAYLNEMVDGWLTSLLQRVRDTLEERGIEPSTPPSGEE
jgi:hypothetical protein